MSSAYARTGQVRDDSKSLTNRLKNNGSKFEPCGTPELDTNGKDLKPLQETKYATVTNIRLH